MKKSLLAVAVAGALPFAAHAQTNVTLYGIADGSVGYNKSDLAPTTAGGPRTSGAFVVGSGVQSTSRIGFRGTEDLGGGLAAIFTAEGSWTLDDGTGNNTAANTGFQLNRQSWVGLQGGFGQVYVGRGYTPSFYTTAANDIGGYGLWGTLGALSASNLQSLRYSNAIFYNTPVWGGLQIRSAVGSATQQGTEYDVSPKGRDRNVEVAAFYAAGPLTLNAAYRFGNQDTAAALSLSKIRQTTIGGGYNFGAFRIVGQYSRSQPSGPGGPVAPAVFNGGYFTANVYSLGAGVRLGAGELMGQVWTARFTDTYVAGAGKPKNLVASLAYTYPLSTRTNLYTSYAWSHNQNGANIPLIASGSNDGATTSAAVAAGSTNNKAQAIAFGIRHMF